MRAFSSALISFCMLAGPVVAQTRTLVIPQGATMVVPPRGSGAMPQGVEARVIAPRAEFTPPPPAGLMELASPGVMAALALVPLAVAGAVLASGLPGSGGGGGTSGPVRTR